MKKKILTVVLLLFMFGAFAQQQPQVFRYEHTGARAAIIKQGTFSEASVLGDLIPFFPSKNRKKLIVYHNVSLVAIKNGKEEIAKGENDVLNAKQLELLRNIQIGEEILIRVEYSYKASENEHVVAGREYEEIEFAVTPGPETAADFPGGKEAMEDYLRTCIISKVPEEVMEEKVSKATVHYTIDENGEIVDPRIFKTSLDPEVDRMLIDAFAKMPKWKPARNSKGEFVKQDFTVNICNLKGGC